jgi:hypothetical protein
MHIKAMFDYKYIGAWSLKGRDVTVEIRSVERTTLRNRQGADTKPVLYFVGSEKGFVCNKTNASAIEGMYGPETDDWIGKRITLYPDRTQVGPKLVDCIRVRPTAPAAKAKTSAIDDAATDDAMRAAQAVAIDLETGEVKD